MQAEVRAKQLKEVDINGEKLIATLYDGDTNWVVPHDTDYQAKLRTEFEQGLSDV